MKTQFWRSAAGLTATGPAAPHDKKAGRMPGETAGAAFDATHVVWALGSLCTLHQRSFSADMLSHEFPPEHGVPVRPAAADATASAVAAPFYGESTLLHAAQRLGFRVKRIRVAARDCASLPLPLLVQVNPPPPPRNCCARRYK